VRVIDAVFRCAAITDRAELVVALALADWSDDYGWSYPSRDVLAAKARLTERGLRKVMKRMGYVEVREGAGPNGTNQYRLDLAWLARGAGGERRTPGTRVTPGGNGVPPIRQ